MSFFFVSYPLKNNGLVQPNGTLLKSIPSSHIKKTVLFNIQKPSQKVLIDLTIKNSRFKHVRCLCFYYSMAYQPDFTICHDTNSKHKSLGCVRFARKTYVLPAKSSELPRVLGVKQPNSFNADITCFSAHRPRPTYAISHSHRARWPIFINPGIETPG